MSEMYNPSQLYDITVNSPKTTGHHDNIIEAKIKTPNGIFVVTYYETKTPMGKVYGAEVYTGANYVIGSTKRSWSMNYRKLKGLPDKWKLVVQRLKEIHRKKF